MILSRLIQREQGDYEKDQKRRHASLHKVGKRTLETLIHTRAALTLEVSPSREFERTHHGGITCMDIERIDGKYMLTGGSDCGVSIYDIEEPVFKERNTTYPVIARLDRRQHHYALSGIQWFPSDTGLFVTSSLDHFVRVWDTNEMSQAYAFDIQQPVYTVALSLTATLHNLVAAGSADPKIRLCDLRTGAATHYLSGHKDSIMVLKWSLQHEFLLFSAGLDKSIICWDVRQAGPGQCLMMFDHQRGSVPQPKRSWKDRNIESLSIAHNGPIQGLALSEDGFWLFSIGGDHLIRCWNTDYGQQSIVHYPEFRMTSKLPLQFCTSHSTDPPLLCAPVRNSLHIYDVVKGDLIDTFHSHYEDIHCVAYHPFRQECFTGSKDRSILSYTPCESHVIEEDERHALVEGRSMVQDYFSDEERS